MTELANQQTIPSKTSVVVGRGVFCILAVRSSYVCYVGIQNHPFGRPLFIIVACAIGAALFLLNAIWWSGSAGEADARSSISRWLSVLTGIIALIVLFDFIEELYFWSFQSFFHSGAALPSRAPGIIAVAATLWFILLSQLATKQRRLGYALLVLGALLTFEKSFVYNVTANVFQCESVGDRELKEMIQDDAIENAAELLPRSSFPVHVWSFESRSWVGTLSLLATPVIGLPLLIGLFVPLAGYALKEFPVAALATGLLITVFFLYLFVSQDFFPRLGASGGGYDVYVNRVRVSSHRISGSSSSIGRREPAEWTYSFLATATLVTGTVCMNLKPRASST